MRARTWLKGASYREIIKGHSGRRTLAEIRIRVTLCATSSAFVCSSLGAKIDLLKTNTLSGAVQERSCRTFPPIVNFSL